MSEQVITITQKNLQDTLKFIDNLAISADLQKTFKHVVSLLCGQVARSERIYLPGTYVYLSGPGISGNAPYLVCITGDARDYRAVRFCSTITGRKAGDAFSKPYQLPHGVEGITAQQIENYLDFQYKVVS